MSEADSIRRQASEYRQEKNTDISLCPLARRRLYVLRHDEEGDNGDGTFYGGYGADADDWMEISGVFLPFFRWSEELRLVRMALTAIPPAVIAVLLFMVGRNILQKEQDRRDAEAGIAETDAPDVEETALEEGNVEQLVEAVLGAEAEKEAEETAEAEEIEAENADKAEETEIKGLLDEMSGRPFCCYFFFDFFFMDDFFVLPFAGFFSGFLTGLVSSFLRTE